MGQGNCEFCQKPFEYVNARLCCTRSCSAKLSQVKKGKAAWTDIEDDFLTDNLGSIPFPMLIKKFQRFSKKNNLPNRTDVAVDVRIHRLTTKNQLSRKCTEDNFTTYELARGLGIKPDRIRVFIRNGQLSQNKVARNQGAISRVDIVALIMKHPERFADIDRDNLFWLLENDEMVQQIKSHNPSTKGRRRAVRCVTPEGKIYTYSGVKEAARANFVGHHCISEAIARNGKSAGKKWEWV